MVLLDERSKWRYKSALHKLWKEVVRSSDDRVRVAARGGGSHLGQEITTGNIVHFYGYASFGRKHFVV